MNRRRAVLLGAAALGVYVVVAAATRGLSGRPVLPLFEGVGPPPAYQWVSPPPAFAAGNTKPKPASIDIAFSGANSVAASAASSDIQFTVNLVAGGIAPHGNDTGLHVTITPLDPATLGPVPVGLAADGNAYRIQVTYQPSATPVDALTAPGDVFTTAPNPARVLLYSSDGQNWTQLTSRTIGATSTVASTFTHPGWYLAGANPTAVISGQKGNGVGTAVIAALVAGLAIALTAMPVGFRALRRRVRGRTDPRPNDNPKTSRRR